jgi:hypothetical protein
MVSCWWHFFVLDPFYFGPQISTGIEYLLWKVVAIGFKINGRYLIDPSQNGNIVYYASEGFGPYYEKDTHAELELLLTASYVFEIK